MDFEEWWDVESKRQTGKRGKGRGTVFHSMARIAWDAATKAERKANTVEANAPFGWAKDTREDDSMTLELTTRPFIAQQWRENGYRVVTLYNLPHRKQDMPANTN